MDLIDSELLWQRSGTMQPYRHLAICILTPSIFLTTGRLLAHTSLTLKEVAQTHNPYSARKVYTNPLTSPAPDTNPALQLIAPVSQSLPDAVRQNLYEQKGLSTDLEVLTQSLRTSPTGRETGEFILTYQTIPLCEHFIKAHRMNGVLFISGEVPDTPNMELPSVDLIWPTEKAVGSWLQQLHPLATIDRQHVQSCWWVPPTGLVIPAYEFHLQEAGEEKRALVGANKLFSLESSSFSLGSSPIMATIQSYTRNPVDGRLQQDQIAVTDPNLLINQYFTIDNGTSPRNSAADHMFVYSPDDVIPFTEANVFAGVNRYRNWLDTIGYKWEGGQITIRLHQLVLGTPDNALYIPAFGSQTTSIIEIGDGDGVILGYLPNDLNVVDHETTHHIIWRAVKSTEQYEVEGETLPVSQLNHSLAIHEGLADSFPFLFEDDPCLAKSVCPATSSICYVPGKCLRTADNTIQYGSDTYWNFGRRVHQKGQVVSGLIWDLRKMEFLPITEFASFVNHSIDYLLQKSTYQDLILALLSTDYELYHSKYCTDIVSAAQARGFTNEVSTINCTNTDSVTTAKNNRENVLSASEVATQTVTTDTGSTNKKNPFCGVGTSDAMPQEGTWMLYLLPLLFFLGKRYLI